MTSLYAQKYDAIGAFASFMCMIHCLATPFLFIASACSATCCDATPLWWQWVDYIFLGVSLFAVINITRTSNVTFVKLGLWVSWLGLFSFFFSKQYLGISAPENLKYIPALSLVGFHLYNLKFCKCENECC
tara:strand:+ start:324 stop:716 length:393 start_codon:yes stop_codon:yes gene_type:complete